MQAAAVGLPGAGQNWKRCWSKTGQDPRLEDAVRFCSNIYVRFCSNPDRLLSGAGNHVNDGAAGAMNGGTIRSTFDGLDEQFGTLTLTDDPVLDFGSFAGGNTFRFTDSASLTAFWATGKELSIWNWTTCGSGRKFFAGSLLLGTGGGLSSLRG